MTRRIPAYICIVFLALTMKMAKAQSGQDLAPHVGFDPYGTFQSSKIDNVNILNGNVVVKIPLLSLPQRGAFKPITYSLINNSMPWTPSSYFDGSGNGYYYANPRGQSSTGPDGMVIRPDTLPASGADISILSFTNDIPDLQEAIQWSVTDYSGASHPAVYNWNDPSELRTLDGSKFRLKFQDLLYLGHTYSEPYFYAHNYDVGFGIDPSYYPSQDVHNVMPDLYDSNGIRTIRSAVGGATQTVIGYTDQDGNVLTVPRLGGETGTDTVGRTIFSGLPSSFSTTDISSHCPDLGFGDQPAHHYAVISLVDIYGTTTPDPRYTYTVCYAMINFRTNIWQAGGTSFPASDGVIGYLEGDSIGNPTKYGPMSAMQSVVLPDGTHWGFVYDNVTSSTWGTPGYVATGMLTKVITPEGGAISYCYDGSYLFAATKDQFRASMPLLTKRWEQATAGINRDACNALPNTYWSYQLYPWGGTYNSTSTASDKVIDPAGNETDYTYDVGGETSETVYQGCASGTSDIECSGTGSVLKATTTTNGYTALPVPYGYDNEQPSYSSYPIATSTSLNGTIVGNTASDYQGDFRGTAWVCSALGDHHPDPPSSCIKPIGSTGTSYLVGQPHHTYTYQGAGTGMLLQSVTTTVQASPSGSCSADAYANGNCYWDNNFLDLPTQVETVGGDAFQQTTYCYDESSPSPTETSCASPGATRGHPTTTFLNPTTETHTAWNANGLPSSHVDANGHSTSYTYDATGLNISTITYQDSEMDAYTFDATSNQLTQHTDPNGNITRLAYDDMRRPWMIQYQDAYNISSAGYSQVACYPSATQVKVYQAQGASTLASTRGSSGLSLATSSSIAGPSSCPTNASAIMMTANVDGLGRAISKIARTPEGDIKSDTLYDFMGRAYATSIPYPASGSPSTWTVTSAYDALSRPLSVYEGSTSTTSPNGDRKQWTYSGLTTTAIDANSNQTATRTDFLGRVVEVDEPLSSGSSPATIPTTYTYNIYGLTGVTQTGIPGTDTARTRSFSYDGLGHLTWATNPEAGSICYGVVSGSNCTGGYDGNGNLVKKTDARGIVTTYAYDNMNRLTGKTYSGSSIATATLSSCYQYGDSATSPPNSKGRLIHEWTKAGACDSSLPSGVKTRHSILNYDAMGRVRQEEQCSLTLCTSFTPTVNYSYDLAGKVFSYSSGFDGFYFSNEFDSAGRLATLTSSWNDPTHPGLLWSSKGYSPAGLLGADIGQNLDLVRSYDSRLRIHSNIVEKH